MKPSPLYTNLVVGTCAPGDQHPEASNEYVLSRGLTQKSGSAQVSTSFGGGSGGRTQQPTIVEDLHASGSRQSVEYSPMDDLNFEHQSISSEELAPAQDPDKTSLEYYLREFGVLSERQINHALTPTRGETVMDMFMMDDSDIGNFGAYTYDLSASVYQLPNQHLDRLVPDLTNPPPTPPPPEKRNRDRRRTHKAGNGGAGRPSETRPDHRQHRKHGVCKKRNLRTHPSRLPLATLTSLNTA